MTPEQIHESGRLLSMLDGIDALAKSAPRYACTGVSLRIAIFDGDDDGGTILEDALLPLSMLDIILPDLRGCVTARLAHLGVKLGERADG